MRDATELLIRNALARESCPGGKGPGNPGPPEGCDYSSNLFAPDHAAKTAALRIVVLKADRLYGDLIQTLIESSGEMPRFRVSTGGFDALDSIQANMP